MRVSEVDYNTRFTLKLHKGVFKRLKKPSVGNVVYAKEIALDLLYFADLEVKELIQ